MKVDTASRGISARELNARVRTAHTQPTWLLASEDVDPLRSGHLQDLGVHVIHIPTAEGPRRLHLGRAFKELRRRGLRRILVEHSRL